MSGKFNNLALAFAICVVLVMIVGYTNIPKSGMDLYVQKTPPVKTMSEVKDCVTGSVYRKYNVTAHNYDTFRARNLLKYDKWKETASNRAASFRSIFKNDVWVASDADARKSGRKSGVGSTWEATVHIRTTLDSVINYIKRATGKKRITMLDAPCGDMFWMSKFLENRDDVEYTGVDIVPELIQSHKAKYPQWKFEHKDVVGSPLGTSYDLIHTRCMTQHLTNMDTLRVLQHFSDSGSLYMLASTYPYRMVNREITSIDAGRYDIQNFEISPYSLHPPVCMHIETSNPGIICYTGLWTLPLKQMTSCNSTSHVKSFEIQSEDKSWMYYYC